MLHPCLLLLFFALRGHNQVHAGSFHVSVICQTMTVTAGPSLCVRDNSYAWHKKGWLGTWTASQHNIFDSEKLIKFILCFWRISNLCHSNVESDALPSESPHHSIALIVHSEAVGFQIPCLSCLLQCLIMPLIQPDGNSFANHPLICKCATNLGKRKEMQNKQNRKTRHKYWNSVMTHGRTL